MCSFLYAVEPAIWKSLADCCPGHSTQKTNVVNLIAWWNKDTYMDFSRDLRDLDLLLEDCFANDGCRRLRPEATVKCTKGVQEFTRKLAAGRYLSNTTGSKEAAVMVLERLLRNVFECNIHENISEAVDALIEGGDEPLNVPIYNEIKNSPVRRRSEFHRRKTWWVP